MHIPSLVRRHSGSFDELLSYFLHVTFPQEFERVVSRAVARRSGWHGDEMVIPAPPSATPSQHAAVESYRGVYELRQLLRKEGRRTPVATAVAPPTIPLNASEVLHEPPKTPKCTLNAATMEVHVIAGCLAGAAGPTAVAELGTQVLTGPIPAEPPAPTPSLPQSPPPPPPPPPPPIMLLRPWRAAMGWVLQAIAENDRQVHTRGRQGKHPHRLG